MSDQAHRRPMEDAAKKRREYLLNTTTNNALTLTGFLAVAFLGFLSIGSFLGIVVSILMAVGGWFGVTICGMGTIVFGLLAYYCTKATMSIPCPPYVPPVAEQLATLPANEVLLRGSDQPTAAPDELLRVAKAGYETDDKELLRPSGS